jgi:hypothetical protein
MVIPSSRSTCLPSNMNAKVSRNHRCRIHLGEPSVIGDSEFYQTCASDSGLRTPLAGQRYAGKEESSLSPTTTPATRPGRSGGTIHEVTVDVAGEPWVDLEKEVVAVFAGD